MTVPINTKVDHRNGFLNAYEMCFYLPASSQAGPPKPTASKVKIIQRSEMKIYSMYVKSHTSSVKNNSSIYQSPSLSFTGNSEDMPRSPCLLRK